MPRNGRQIAALPMRWDDKGRVQVLLVTSRGTGRWVMPKGWEMTGKSPWAAAELEALEEAGAQGVIGRDAIGSYDYGKVLDDGRVLPCRVEVYPMLVQSLKRDWKERGMRRRRWFRAKDAARKVDEQDLARLLRRLGKGRAAGKNLRGLRRAAG